MEIISFLIGFLISFFRPAPSPTPTPSAYVCPAQNYVDCMPKVIMPSETPKPNIECTPQYLTWAKANCPGFQGAAY